MIALLRPYAQTDEVFDFNIPKYFSVGEREDFAHRLPSCAYLVLERAGEIVGCGYYVNWDSREAGVC